MNDLVINHNGTLATTQDKVSDLTDNNEQSVQRLIRTHKADLEEFGKLEFYDLQIQAGLGFTYKKVYQLNEQQATLLLTYMKNTPKVREAKKLLVKAFYDMKQELQALKFKHYVDEISSLNAVLIDKAKRHHREINGYKSQIAQHNKAIAILKHELTKNDKDEKIKELQAQVNQLRRELYDMQTQRNKIAYRLVLTSERIDKATELLQDKN